MKKILSLILALMMTVSLFALPSCSAENEAKTTAPQTQATANTTAEEKDPATIHLMALQGPTGMGLAKLYEDAANGNTEANYEISLVTSAEISNIAAAVSNGSCDIAAVPVNLASTLYNKTQGGVQVICVNTLGVLYLLENGESVKSVSDLRGKTIYATGQGSTPEYVLRHVLSENGIDPETDVRIEFVSDHTELATLMAQDKAAIGMLPEPNVTVVRKQNSDIRVALDMTEEWNKIADGTELVQGVYIARKAFIEEHPTLVSTFMKEYNASQEFINANAKEGAEKIAACGIVAKAAVAEAAIPGCNITFRDGKEMKNSVAKCLEVLLAAAPQSVGGKLPADDFYFSR